MKQSKAVVNNELDVNVKWKAGKDDLDIELHVALERSNTKEMAEILYTMIINICNEMKLDVDETMTIFMRLEINRMQNGN